MNGYPAYKIIADAETKLQQLLETEDAEAYDEATIAKIKEVIGTLDILSTFCWAQKL